MHQVAKRIQQGQPFIEMVHVESGRYRLEFLGSKPYNLRKSFWISNVPVTNKLLSFVTNRFDKEEIPATSVSWFQALHFCNVLSRLDGFEPCYTLGIGPDQVFWNQEADGYRLPTEYEWEIAAQPGFAHKSTRWNRFIWSAENTSQLMTVAKKTPNHRCLYDMLGNVVNNLVNANQSSGYKSVQWNATNNLGKPVSAGVYLYKIQAGDFIDTKKMILLK